MDGPSLRTYRHAPNVGKRKSWAAADAVSRAIEISEISLLDDENYSGILKDSTWGFENIYFENATMHFGKTLDNWVINNVLFKVLYPAEFHGQSAVEAAAQLSNEFLSKKDITKEIVIETHEPAIRIISNKEILKPRNYSQHFFDNKEFIRTSLKRSKIKNYSSKNLNISEKINLQLKKRDINKLKNLKSMQISIIKSDLEKIHKYENDDIDGFIDKNSD